MTEQCSIANEEKKIKECRFSFFVKDVHEERICFVDLTILSKHEYCIVLDPVPEGASSSSSPSRNQFGQRQLRRGPASFFLQPGERFAITLTLSSVSFPRPVLPFCSCALSSLSFSVWMAVFAQISWSLLIKHCCCVHVNPFWTLMPLLLVPIRRNGKRFRAVQAICGY